MRSNPPRGPAILHTAKQTSSSSVCARELKPASPVCTQCAARGCTHKYEVSEAKLHGAKHAQDHGHDVQEVGQDGSPLVAQEIKHLPLEGCHLEDRGGRGSFIKGKGPGRVSTAEDECIHITYMKKHIQVIKVPHTPQLYIHTHTQWQGHTYTGLPQLFPW